MKSLHLAVVLPLVAALGYFFGTGLSPVVVVNDESSSAAGSASPSSAGAVSGEQEHAANAELANGVADAAFPGGRATIEDILKAFLLPVFAERYAVFDRALLSMDSAGLAEIFSQYGALNRNQQFIFLPRAIKQWLAVDPKSASAWIESAAETFRPGSQTFPEILRSFALTNPALGSELLEKLKPGERKDFLRRVLLEQRAVKDLPGAIAAMESYPEGSPERNAAGAGILSAIATHRPWDVFGPFATAQLEKYPEKRDEIMYQAVSKLAQSGSADLEGFLDRMLDTKERARMMEVASYGMTSGGLQRLASYYVQKLAVDPSLAEHFSGQARLIQGIAETDGPQALRLAAELPEASRAIAELSAVFSWAGSEPLKAIAWAEGQADESKRAASLQRAFSSWAGRAATDAMAWLDKQPDSDVKRSMTEIAVREFAAQGNHDRALDLAEKLSPKNQRSIAGNIASSLAAIDPKLAAKWLGQIEVDNDLVSHYGRVAENWAEKDFKGAATWISGLPASMAKDNAAARFAVKSASRDPVVAGEWAMSVADMNTRAKAVREVYFAWERTDRAAARQWALASGLKKDQLDTFVR